jgi:hypothetical protein
VNAPVETPPQFRFVGTFGIGQARAGKFVRLTAVSEAEARAKMRAAYGDEWSMVREVTSADPDPAGTERWGLIEIEFGGDS